MDQRFNWRKNKQSHCFASKTRKSYCRYLYPILYCVKIIKKEHWSLQRIHVCKPFYCKKTTGTRVTCLCFCPEVPFNKSHDLQTAEKTWPWNNTNYLKLTAVVLHFKCCKYLKYNHQKLCQHLCLSDMYSIIWTVPFWNALKWHKTIEATKEACKPDCSCVYGAYPNMYSNHRL